MDEWIKIKQLFKIQIVLDFLYSLLRTLMREKTNIYSF